ncbi:MAG: peptidoglycan-associated lipoprotein Pal [Woeseiaceae bacterium]
MSNLKLIAVLLATLSLTACGGSNTIPDPEPTDTVYDGSAGGAGTDGYDDGSMTEGEFFEDDLAGGELTNIIYFEFDSSELRDDDQELVSRHAMQLANNPSATVRLEGHADERGSREYNIGLGERRSQTVRRMLLIQGATSSQIQTVSFGEERPAALGSSEEDYSLNRRVEIKYIN